MKRIVLWTTWVAVAVFSGGISYVPSAYPFGSFGTADPEVFFNCGYTNVSGQFTAKLSSYYIYGACLHNTSQIQVPWSATGKYEPASAAGHTTEIITLTGPSPYRGTLTSTMECAGLRENQDPWLTKVICGSFNLQPQGEFVAQKVLLDAIYKLMQSRGGPLTASFPYDRNALLAKRDTDLKAEALQIQAALAAQKREQQLLQGAAQSQATSYSAALSPSVLGPVVGQQFYNRAPVAIKLAPPKGWNVTSYLVKLQRKDAAGKWFDHANIPVGAAEAQSPAGYTGFGAGAPPAFLSLPGAWRLSAQVSYPKPTGWSDWREFYVVTALHPPANTRVKK